MFPARDGFEQEYPFESHEFRRDGLRYHYVDEGSGPVLLFVHGNPTWSFAFRNLIKALAPQYRVLAVDHIGCGFSDKPQSYPYRLAQHIENLERFVVGLDLHDVTLFAHDWGGAIGLGAATHLFERFSRFVLFNTAAFRSKHMPLRIALCRVPGLGALGVRGLNLFSQAALRMAVAKPAQLSEAVKRGYLAPYGNWHDRVAVLRFVQDIPLAPGHPSYQALVAIEESLVKLRDRPMLLVWGERDWCFTTEFLDEFQHRFPNAETLRLPDAGHYVFEDEPDRIIGRVKEFLAKAHTLPPRVSSQSDQTAEKSAHLASGLPSTPG
jgi:pimeloyl-ACP methyl ester carboxylesterase